jgi:hypothetical protein
MVRHRVANKRDNIGEDDDDYLALLTNVKSLQYVGKLHFGQNAQEFKCIYDTGSSNTWAYSDKCTTEACKKHTRFATGNLRSDKEVSIEYGSGKIVGSLFEGPVGFEKCNGGCSSGACHCSPKADWIGVTRTEGEAFEYGEFNCILGLAHPKLAVDNTHTTLKSLSDDNKLNGNMFSFFLTKTQDTHGSQFLIGQPKKELYKGDMYWYDLYHPGDADPSYWSIKMTNIILKYDNGEEKSVGGCGAGCTLAVDTGTSLLTGPSTPVYSLIDQVDVEEDCSNFDKLPRIGFVLENPTMTFWLNPSSYVYREKEDGHDVCIGSFYPLDVPSKTNFWIAGDTFLSSYYSVYDAGCWHGGKCRVGLAARNTGSLGHDDTPKLKGASSLLVEGHDIAPPMITPGDPMAPTVTSSAAEGTGIKVDDSFAPAQ